MRANLVLVAPGNRHHFTYRETVSLLPEEYQTLLAKDKAKNEDMAKALFVWVMKYGRHWLDISTMMVFQFILWRTYTYYKRAELISRSQFLRGVWDSKNSESNCAPATTSTHTLYKALGILEEMGFIRQTAIKINGADAISLFEIDCKVVLDHGRLREDDVAKLRESRKSKAQVVAFPTERESFFDNGRQCTSALGGVVHKCTTEGKPKTSKPKEEETKKTGCSVPRNEAPDAIDCKRRVEEVVQRAASRTTALREAKVARAARGSMITLTDLNASWKQSMIAAYGSCTVAGLTTKEYGIFRRTTKASPLECSWKEFFTWVISSWQQINKEAKEFSEYKRKKGGDWSLREDTAIFLGTAAPDLFMVVKNYGKLIKRFSQKSLAHKSVAAEDAPEVKKLREELAASRREVGSTAKLLERALRGPSTLATPRPAPRQVRTVSPEQDKFFEEVDSDLPQWK